MRFHRAEVQSSALMSREQCSLRSPADAPHRDRDLNGDPWDGNVEASVFRAPPQGAPGPQTAGERELGRAGELALPLSTESRGLPGLPSTAPRQPGTPRGSALAGKTWECGSH